MRALVCLWVLGLVFVVVRDSAEPASSQEEPATNSALQELEGLLESSASGEELANSVESAARRGPSEGDDPEAWRAALDRAIRDERFPYQFPILIKRLRESYENEGSYSRGLNGLADLQESLEDPTWLELRQIKYAKARLARASGEYVAANVLLVELSNEEPPSGLLDGDLDLHDWMQGNIFRELILSCFETGQLPFAARLAAERNDLVMKARTSLGRRRYELALQNLDQFESQGGAGWMTTRLSTRAVALWRLGRTDEARQILEATLSNPKISRAWRHSNQLSLGRLALESGDLKLAEDMLKALSEARAEGPLRAVRVSNLEYRLLQSRGDGVDDLARARDRVRDDYRDWLEVWKSGPLVPSGLEFLGAYKRQEVLQDVVEAELSVSGGEVRALQCVMNAQACGTTARRMGASVKTVAELQAYLGERGGGLIVFVPGPEATYVFCVDAKRVSVGRAVSRQSLAAVHRSIELVFRREPGEDPTDDLQDYASQVTAAFLPEEIRDRLESWPKVRFTGIDVMTPLPAAMLRTRDGRWLGCAQQVAEWPSIQVALALAERPSGDWSNGVALIEPDAPSGASAGKHRPLSFTSAERARLAAALGGSERVASGAAATVEALSRSKGGVAYVHCHGGMDYASARPGRLVLSGERQTSSVDIERALSGPTPPRHVILGACGAGRGKRTMGEDGADHLGAAFLVMGARSLLIPTIDVYHGPTKEFALTHLEGLASGLRVGDSITRTRRAMIADGVAPLDVLALRWVGVAR